MPFFNQFIISAMVRFYVLLILITFCPLFPAQNMCFVYEVKYQLTKQETNKIRTNYMVLDIVNNISIFREKIDRNQDSIALNNGFPMLPNGFENQFYIKKDFANIKTSKIITNGHLHFLLPITEKLDWKISNKKRKIGIYNCQNAELNYGGRTWEAWFTTDIPISDGPYIFNGLPGLIISISDHSNDYSFNLIQAKKNLNIFDARIKTIEIDWAKFEQLAKSYYDNPNAELEQKISSNKVMITDGEGKKIDLDIKRMNREQQEYIRKFNNPIELNHRIDYK